jgi:protein SERAC1
MITERHTVTNSKNLIVLIHGFIGSEKTWVKEDGSMPFINQLLEDDEVQNNFTIGTFEYHSNLVTLFPKTKAFLGMIKGKKSPYNLPIEQIAELLQTVLSYRYDNYENIVLIGHSMGGLVAKRYVLNDIAKNSSSRVKLYVSVATPHNGADLATIGTALIDNVQMKDLQPLSESVTSMGNEWVQCTSLPKRLYAQGSYDRIVPRESSVSFDRDSQEVIYCDEDHSSIIVPNTRSIVVDAITKELKEIIKEQKIKEIENQESFVDDGRYDEEVFVLKLLMADIHNTLVSGTKEAFFHAEFAIRKLDALGVDFGKLVPLYNKIKEIYTIEFGNLLAGKHPNSDALLTAVHQRIKDEDKTNLHTFHLPLQSLQKFGMLHQLADRDLNIWWAKEHNITTFEDFVKKSKTRE